MLCKQMYTVLCNLTQFLFNNLFIKHLIIKIVLNNIKLYTFVCITYIFILIVVDCYLR
jgi:hypothetical protein